MRKTSVLLAGLIFPLLLASCDQLPLDPGTSDGVYTDIDPSVAGACTTSGITEFGDRASFEAEGAIAFFTDFEDVSNGFPIPLEKNGVTYSGGPLRVFGPFGANGKAIGNNSFTPIVGATQTDPDKFNMLAMDLSYIVTESPFQLDLTTNLATYCFRGIDAPDAMSGQQLFLGFVLQSNTEFFTGFRVSADLPSSTATLVDNVTLGLSGEIVPPPEEIAVEIDIKPGNERNRIKLNSRGFVAVAVLTTEDFDAADVDPSTVTLGNDDGNDTPVAARRNGRLKAKLTDVDDDGDLDLRVRFSVQELIRNGDLDRNTTELFLNGQTIGGEDIKGSDAVTIKKKRRG